MAAMIPTGYCVALRAKNKHLERRLARAEETIAVMGSIGGLLTGIALSNSPFRSLANVLLDAIGAYYAANELDKEPGSNA